MGGKLAAPIFDLIFGLDATADHFEKMETTCSGVPPPQIGRWIQPLSGLFRFWMQTQGSPAFAAQPWAT
jgi:hypothetical protein